MKKIAQITLLGVFCITAIAAFAQNNQLSADNGQDGNIFYHTVERGQTVYSIAKMYDVTVDDIYKLNVGSEESIKAGDQLKVPQKVMARKETRLDPEKDFIFHTIQSKETLFGVSQKYGVDGESIIQANPGLSLETFRIGRTIRIPTGVEQKKTAEIVETERGAKEVYYTIPPGETMYNISRTFKTTEKELLKLNPELAGGLRSGMTLRIPLRISEKDLPKEVELDPNKVNALLNVQKQVVPVDAAKVAILLPFDSENPQTNDFKRRMTEFYEGMLLASDSLRKAGHSAELFVYDIGKQDETAKTRKILQEKQNELKNVNLIIGGVSGEQIRLIAEFSKQNKVKYVIPFTPRNDEALNNAYIFQINTPPHRIHANAAFAGANRYAGHNIIFLDTKDADVQTDFIKEFKRELNDRNIPYKEMVYDMEKFDEDIAAALVVDKPNMIMPISLSLEALNKIKNVLRIIAETKPEHDLSLFGYPIWQTYTDECLEDFHALNTCIFSLFYADNINPNVNRFYENYKNWYSKNPAHTFPKYALLGFDTGMYFLSAIRQYGENFEDKLSLMKYNSIQTGFHFERVNNWGGFINTNVYMIHYNKDYTITRSDFK
jgi:LysM repeat protein